jgi:anti-sigma B factor antagonist
MLLEITERQMAPDITVVELTGKLGMGRECQRVEMLVDDLVKRRVKRVILDMTGVDYADSAGIGMLALAAGRMKESGGSLAVVASEGRVLHLLNLTQLTSIIKVCPTVDTAAAAL